MRIKKKGVLYLFIVIFVTILAFGIDDLGILKILCCICFIACTLVREKGEGISLYTIFIFMMFFFAGIVVFADVVGIYDISVFSKYGKMFNYTDDLVNCSLRSIIIYLDAAMIVKVLWPNSKNDNSIKQLNCRSYIDGGLVRILRLVFYILFIPSVFKSIIEVVATSQYGYIATIHLRTISVGYSILDQLDFLFELVGLLVLYCSKDKKEFLKIAIIYSIPQALTILTGQRGPGIILIVVLVWMYSKYFGKIDRRLLLGMVVSGVLLMTLIGITRWGGEKKVNGFWDAIQNFFLGQGECINVLNLTIQFKDKFINKVPFLFGYFTDIFSTGNNYTIEAITNKNYLAFHVAYLAFPSAYFAGYTMGTSLIAETYELASGNYFIILLLGMSFSCICRMFENHLFDSPLWFVIGFKYIMYYLYSPRYSVGKIISIETLYTFIFMMIVMAFNNLIIKNKKPPKKIFWFD